MDFSRRRFLWQLTVLTGSSLLPLSPIQAEDGPIWVAVGTAANFSKDTWTRVVLPPEAKKSVVYIRHAPDEGYLALSARCTHRGCEVIWDGGSHEFVCPCHNGRFDAEGHQTSGPPRKPLPALPTKIDVDGQLLVLAK